MFGTLNIYISTDMMQASAAIDPTGHEYITEALFKSKMTELGIKAGIKQDAIQELLIDTNVGKEMIIAEGKPATAGRDGYFEFMFSTDNEGYKPSINEDGSIDYSVQRSLVTKGDLLGAYHAPKPGFFGYTVFSSVVAPVPPKDDSKIKLENVEEIDNNYYALIDGEASYKNGILSVNDVLNINGDASIVMGVIEYSGDIIINGDVLTGTVIKTSGSVTVAGTVEAATITAGKDIFVRKGIQGKEKAMIRAGHDVVAAFIEEATVVAGNSIRFNYSYCSNIISGNEIIADGRHGSVLGGTASAAKLIRTKYAGNDVGVKTKLSINKGGERISDDSTIIIEKTAYDGSYLFFGDENYVAGSGNHGEYHLVQGIVKKYEIGEYTPMVEIRIENEVVRKKVLLVDDEPIILKTFYRYLREDYDVSAVTSAKEALKVMDTVHPDLLLLDYNMPVMDGGQLLQEMRKRTWKNYHNVPVIFVTAVTDKSTIEKCLSLYPQGYLIKPIGQEALQNAVKKYFDSVDLSFE